METVIGKMPFKAPLYLKVNSEPFKLYEKLLSEGAFKNKKVFGVSEKDSGFVTLDPATSSGSLFCGGMGSGKSLALRFSAITQLLANSEDTALFVIDPLQGAGEFSILTRKHPRLESHMILVQDGREKFTKVLEEIYEEFLKRKNDFILNKSVNLEDHEKYTGKKLTRMVIVIENFHSIPSLDCVKYHMKMDNPDSLAFKLKTLMRTGRSYGISFMIATQRATSDDIPSSLKPGLSTMMSFYLRNTSDAAAMNLAHAQDITLSERGRCAYDGGFMQFPYLDDDTIVELLKKHLKPLTSSFLHINFNDYVTITNSPIVESSPHNFVLKVNPLQSQPTPKKVDEIITKILKIPVTNDLKNKLYDFYNEISQKELTPGQIISYFLRSSKFFFKTEPDIKDLEVLILKEKECEPTQQKLEQIIAYISLVINKKFSMTETDVVSNLIINEFRSGEKVDWETIINKIQTKCKDDISTSQIELNNNKLNDLILDLTLKINTALKSEAKSFCLTEDIFQTFFLLKGIEQLKSLIKSFKDKNFKVEKNQKGEIVISDGTEKPSYQDFVSSVLE